MEWEGGKWAKGREGEGDGEVRRVRGDDGGCGIDGEHSRKDWIIYFGY